MLTIPVVTAYQLYYLFLPLRSYDSCELLVSDLEAAEFSGLLASP